ncbi:hypothetical protein IAD21_00467 [Abditibacteriota bacterium]|nr:hypothetical protein IAD21_00467 [Abditibacteriota bacterium]
MSVALFHNAMHKLISEGDLVLADPIFSFAVFAVTSFVARNYAAIDILTFS